MDAEGKVPGALLDKLPFLRRPSLRLPAIRRILHKVARGYRDNQKGDAEISKCLQYAYALNQSCCNGRSNQSAGSEASDGNARHQSTTIRKPLYQDRDRNDVGKTESDAADNAVSQVKPPKSMIRKAGEKDTGTVQ